MNLYDIEFPEWKDVSEFAKWYTDNHMPVIIKGPPRIYVTENATSYIAFEHGRFQSEMYIAHPDCLVDTPDHSHPGVDLITIPLNYYGEMMWGNFISLNSGDTHNAKFPTNGSVFLTCQHWIDTRKMTSAAVNWTGKLVGHMQEKMIRKYYPDAVIENGFVDTTMVAK